MLVKQPTARPTRKVMSGTLWGLGTAAAITVINRLFPGAGDVLQEPTIAAFLTALLQEPSITGFLSVGVGSLAAYITKERR
jgi:hypothetical protein